MLKGSPLPVHGASLNVCVGYSAALVLFPHPSRWPLLWNSHCVYHQHSRAYCAIIQMFPQVPKREFFTLSIQNFNRYGNGIEFMHPHVYPLQTAIRLIVFDRMSGDFEPRQRSFSKCQKD